MQARIDWQRTQPRPPRAQRPPPALTYLAQGRELLFVQASNRGLRANVGQLFGGDACALAAAVSTDS
jgi:hypothetical protein